MSKDEVDDIVRAAGREPQQVQDTASFSVIGPSAETWGEYGDDRKFKGRDDGKMRVEIDASQARLKEGRFVSTRRYVLSDMLDFDELYRAYPELRYFTVDIEPLRRGVYASLELSLRTKKPTRLRLARSSMKNRDEVLSNILHEVQHWVQLREGFAGGGNSKFARKMMREKMNRSMNEKYLSGNVTAANEVRNRINEFEDLNDYEIYKRVAGEIEARNVQARQDLSEAERASVPFNETLEYPGEAISYTFAELMRGLTMSVAEREIEAYRENRIEFNVVSATDEDARAYQMAQMRKVGLSDEEIGEYFGLLDVMVSEVLEKAEGSPELKAWQEEALLEWVDEKGNLLPSVSAYKNNGDYPVNIDLGTICVKREMMTLLTDKLVAEGYADRLGVSQLEQLKELMKEAGIATACDICFVESHRIRALQQAQQLSFFWNAVRVAAGIEGHKPIGKHGALTKEQVAKLEQMANKKTRKQVLQELVSEMHRRNEKLDKGLSPKTMGMIAEIFLQDNSLAGEATLGDFLSVERIDFMMRQFPHTSVRGLLDSAFGPSTAKPVEGFNVYDHLSWRKFDAKSLEKMRTTLYNIGGGRVQSFTDFNPVLFLDYYQMMFDFAWRQLPLQAYTKVASFVELFGQCGIKINMSLVPEVVDGVDAEHAGLKPTADGGWEFAWHKDSFPVDLAFKYRENEAMHENCGTVAVGISKEHVLALLRSELIDYVIPYHRSGMPVATQIKTGLDKATDFTDVQNTVKPGAKAYKDKFKFNEALRKHKDPKKAAQAYLDYCDKNKLIPKFSEFRNEENYYKLLVDFRVYNKSGEYSPQGPVTTKMPENWGAILDLALGARAKETARMEKFLQSEYFMNKAREILKQTPLEGELRTVLVDRLNKALKRSKEDVPVKCLKASEFDSLMYAKVMENLKGEEGEKYLETLRLRNGIVYGFTDGGVLYLKENTFNAHTPVHEFTHVWAKVAQQANPALWAEGVKLLKKTMHWKDVLTDPLYAPILGNEDAVASEVLSRITGNMTERMVQDMMNPERKQLTEKGIMAKITAWLKAMLDSIRSIFDAPGGKPLTLKELARMPLTDLFDDTRNARFNDYVRKEMNKTDAERRVELQGMSASMVDINESDIAYEVEAAGTSFRANLEFSERILKEMRNTLQRLRKLGSKTRSDREDAIAAIGSMVHLAKAAVMYLPKGYRFAVHPYLPKLEALAEIATSGQIDLTKDVATRSVKDWLKAQQGISDVTEMKGQGAMNFDTDAVTRELAEMQLSEALERVMNRVAGQLRKHARDKAVEKMVELVERMKAKKDPKSGRVKGGKMSAESYRDLVEVETALGMDEKQLAAKLAALEAELKTEGLSDEKRAGIESLQAIYDQYGDPANMTAEEAVEAHEALRQRIWLGRFEWDNIMAERRAAQRRVVEDIVRKVGKVDTNKYNKEKEKMKPTKRVKYLGDILSNMTGVLTAMTKHGALRNMARELMTRANMAGELIKQREAERWEALEKLSRATMGKSWRLCMDDMHARQKTGIRFERPSYRSFTRKVSELNEWLNMSPEEREAERERRKANSALEAETILSDADLEAALQQLSLLAAQGQLRSSVTVRYAESVEVTEDLELSRGQALYAILMYEQPTYTERMEAQGYTPEVMSQLREFVGEGMLQFGYGLRELFAKQGDRVAAVYEATFGVPFPREVNYFAARWNVTEMKGDPEQDLLASMGGTAGAGKGWQKQRVKHELELDMTKDALQVFLQATTLTDAWMATQDIVADFKAWTRDKRFDKALTVTLGGEGYQNLKEWIRIMEEGGVRDCVNMGVSQDVINNLYSTGAVAILGLRVQTWLKQIPAVFNGLLGAHDISSAEWFAAMTRLRHGEAPMTYGRMMDSAFMKSRQQGKAGVMAGQATRSGDMQSSVAEEFLWQAMKPMEAIDARATAIGLVPVWNVYYDRAMKKGASAEEAEQAAWEQTIIVANLSSQPIGWLNKTKIGQVRSPLVKASFFMLSENMAKVAMFRNLWQAGHKGAAIRAWLVYGAANAAISALLDWMQGDPEKWEEATFFEYLVSAIYGPLAAVPGISEMLSGAVTGAVRGVGHALDWDDAKDFRTHVSVGRALIDFDGAGKAAYKIFEYMTDDKEQSLAEYMREVSRFSRTLGIVGGLLGNAFGYWSTAAAVLMNPIDFFARVYRNWTYEE